MNGTLYVVGTPIGNLGDITLRAMETLKSVDAIAAEDTRRTVQLLNHLDIHKELISFHEHSGEKRTGAITSRILAGESIALVSDAGMPMISDPGYQLTKACIEAQIPVCIVPGPTAGSSAVAISGIDCRRYLFCGFLASKQSQRRKELSELASAGVPLVIYESPNRVIPLLEDISYTLGADTQVCAARELTKIYEEALRGTAGEVAHMLSERGTPKGEFSVVVDARKDQNALEDDELREQLGSFIADGMSTRDAARYAATVFDVPKKRIYKILLDMERSSPSENS